MIYKKNDIIKHRNDIVFVITKVDKIKDNYRAVPLKQYQQGLGDMLTCIIKEEDIVKLIGRYTKYGTIIL